MTIFLVPCGFFFAWNIFSPSVSPKPLELKHNLGIFSITKQFYEYYLMMTMNTMMITATRMTATTTPIIVPLNLPAAFSSPPSLQ